MYNCFKYCVSQNWIAKIAISYIFFIASLHICAAKLLQESYIVESISFLLKYLFCYEFYIFKINC